MTNLNSLSITKKALYQSTIYGIDVIFVTYKKFYTTVNKYDKRKEQPKRLLKKALIHGIYLTEKYHWGKWDHRRNPEF